ncbi:hypothetical protein [Pedobacter sp. L105]|uniref:hypothetical protein n=1 Tax=Pedobacter sp. L105 TaxID=1641871 RepID=UPI00131C8BA0|nr:hypothetical protein [Pedobacter sp. L105]
MAATGDHNAIALWQTRGMDVLFYLLKKWYFLCLAAVAGGLVGYLLFKRATPIYKADISFVLSTDQKDRNNFAGLASQMGFDGIAPSADNIFSGDNIVELFKSRKLIGSALLSVIDSPTHQSLLNYITQSQYRNLYLQLGPFNQQPNTYSAKQNRLYRKIITEVGKSFFVFKKDKKLVFFIISAQSSDPKIAYHVSKCLLNETARYFIETKTKVAAKSVNLLQHEADSIATVLRTIFSSTAVMNDQTYNLNPSISVQRSGSMFNQAKAMAFSAAYTEVMRNLEISKITLQKETPLYRIIDEPELPLVPVTGNLLKYILPASAFGFLLMAVLLAGKNLSTSSKSLQ